MPHYLDNIWGDQQVVRGFGDALNNNMAALVAARNQRTRDEQAAALNAAYYTLERQKLALQQPGMEAQTAEARARAAQMGLQNQLMQGQMADANTLRGAVMRQYQMANPAMQPVPPQVLPTQPPMLMQTNAIQQAMPGQVPSIMPPGAPTIGNANQMDAGTIKGILAAQMMQNPQTARALIEGQVLRPGDVPVSDITDQRSQQVPGFVTPQQQFEQLYKMQALADLNRYRGQQVNLGQERVDKPPKESFAERALREAQERRQGKSGNAPSRGASMSRPTTTTAMPQIGEVRQGYRFKGGDPANQSNWEVVQ